MIAWNYYDVQLYNFCEAANLLNLKLSHFFGGNVEDGSVDYFPNIGFLLGE